MTRTAALLLFASFHSSRLLADICCLEGNLPLLPDALEIVFPPPGSNADDGSPRESTFTSAGEGERIDTRVVFVAETPAIQGWAYAVAHDPEVLTLLGESVTTDGTIVDPTHPEAVILPPTMAVTRAVFEDATQQGPLVGYISALVLAFLVETELPLGRQAVANASYIVSGDPGAGTSIRFADEEIGSPPVRIVITARGRAGTPSRLVDGLVTGTPRFIRGDADGGGEVNITDAVIILQVLFGRRPQPFSCASAIDVDGNRRRQLTDAVALLNYLFRRGAPPPPPFEACGPAREGDECEASSAACAP